MDDKEIQESVDRIPGNYGWWKDSSRDVFLLHAKYLKSVGMSVEGILSILKALYYAAVAEYGD